MFLFIPPIKYVGNGLCAVPPRGKYNPCGQTETPPGMSFRALFRPRLQQQLENTAIEHNILAARILVKGYLFCFDPLKAQGVEQRNGRRILKCRAGGQPFNAKTGHILNECQETFLGVALAVICGVKTVSDLMSVLPDVKGDVSDHGIIKANGEKQMLRTAVGRRPLCNSRLNVGIIGDVGFVVA